MEIGAISMEIGAILYGIKLKAFVIPPILIVILSRPARTVLISTQIGKKQRRPIS